MPLKRAQRAKVTAVRNLTYPKTFVQYLLVSVKGFVMGAADVIPGVSGGTMALIMGIYEELIHAITQFSRGDLYARVFSGKLGKAFGQIRLGFLVALVLGIGAAVLSLAGVLEHLLTTQPVWVFSFFFGLILASVWVVGKLVRVWNAGTVSSFVVGAVLAFVIVGLTPTQTPEAPWFIFLSGAVAICALILPGISGSFILLLLGKYAFVLGAVNDRNLGVIVVFALGAAVGLLGFAKVLNWLLTHYYDLLIAVLCGFMLGSLRKIWPWKVEVGDGLQLTRNVLPGGGLEPLYALLLALLGIVLVLLISRQGERQGP